ncbi:hypothetical protein K431DRAFT_103495 [Polychaeton citri CBS 116435]|uniref:Myb-like domain-containing protein n=1 Tax=Polychaeton citri CBS 116435 TaxID=1314669 RepID=A0A9P4Q5J3_9PEZI|nr:hypothetical protein K431DRAFT_103495 [Polychaeton citri CBS 116435]
MTVSECTDEDAYSSSAEDESQLQRDRNANNLRLKRRFEDIFEKYARDFTGVGDEIDISTGDVVVDNGHLEHMRHEVDPGNAASSQFVQAFADNLEHEDDDEEEDGEEGEELEDNSSDCDMDEEDVSFPEGNMPEEHWSSSEDDPLSEGMEPSDSRPMSGSMSQLLQAQVGASYLHEGYGMSESDSIQKLPPPRRKAKPMKQKRKEANVDAIQALGQNIAGQIARFMHLAGSTNPPKQKPRLKDTTWDYPELPRKKRKIRREPGGTQYQEKLKTPFGFGASPVARSLWAPAPPAPRRKHHQVDNRFYRLSDDDSTVAGPSQPLSNKPALPPDTVDDFPVQQDDFSGQQYKTPHHQHDLAQQHQSPYRQQQGVTCLYDEEEGEEEEEEEEHTLQGNDVPQQQNDDTVVDESIPECLDEFGMPESPVRHTANVGTKRRFTLAENILLVKLKGIHNLSWEKIGAYFPSRSVGGLQNHFSLRIKEGWYEQALSTLKSQGYRVAQIERILSDERIFPKVDEDGESGTATPTQRSLYGTLKHFESRALAYGSHAVEDSRSIGQAEVSASATSTPRQTGSASLSAATVVFKRKMANISPPFPIADFGVIPDRPSISPRQRYWFKYRTRYIEAEDLQLSYLRGEKKLPWNIIELWFPNRSGKTLGVRWLALLAPTFNDITNHAAEAHNASNEHSTTHLREPELTLRAGSELEQGGSIECQPETEHGNNDPTIADSHGDDESYHPRAPLLRDALQRTLRQRSRSVAPTNYYNTLVDNLEKALAGTEQLDIAGVQESDCSTATSQQGDPEEYAAKDNVAGDYWPATTIPQIEDQGWKPCESDRPSPPPSDVRCWSGNESAYVKDGTMAIDPLLLADGRGCLQPPQEPNEEQAISNEMSDETTGNEHEAGPHDPSITHRRSNSTSLQKQGERGSERMRPVEALLQSRRKSQNPASEHGVVSPISRGDNDDNNNLDEPQGEERDEGASKKDATTISSPRRHRTHRRAAIESRSRAKTKTRQSYPPVNASHSELKTPAMKGRPSGGRLSNRAVRFSIPGSTHPTKRRVVETPVREAIDSDEDELAL